MEIAGDKPSMVSTSGFSMIDRKLPGICRQGLDSGAGPSAYRVSEAREDFPEPDSPVITISLSRGSVRSMFFRLWVRAPRISILSSMPLAASVNRQVYGWPLISGKACL